MKPKMAQEKLILILTLLTALFLAGCTSPSYEGDQCYDNDVCSVKEQYLGGCADCIPDLEVQQDNFYVNLNDDTLEANVCVKNLHGEYEGDVSIKWCVSDNDQGECNWEEENVYFESQEVQGNLNIDVGPGKLNAWSNLQIGDQEEIDCFQHEFDVIPSTDHYVHFGINNNQEVEEQDYDNNDAYMFIEGNLDLSEYLIGHDIGDFEFDDWYYHESGYESNDQLIFEFNYYNAGYTYEPNNHGIIVNVMAEFSQGNVEDFFNLMFENYMDYNSVYSTEINGQLVYYFEEDEISVVFWLSNEKFVEIHSMEGIENDVVFAYLEKHPSILESVNYDSFAQCLTEEGAILYMVDWDSHSQDQIALFGDSSQYLNMVNCDENSKTCEEEEISGYPTWRIGETELIGLQQLEDLSQETGCIY